MPLGFASYACSGEMKYSGFCCQSTDFASFALKGGLSNLIFHPGADMHIQNISKYKKTIQDLEKR